MVCVFHFLTEKKMTAGIAIFCWKYVWDQKIKLICSGIFKPYVISLKSNAHLHLFQSAKYEVVIYNMELLLADSDWAPRIMFPLRILFIFLLRGSVSLFCKTSISAALKMKLDLNHFVQSTGCKKSMLIFHSPEGAFVNFISISIFFHPGERGFGWC